MSEKIIEVEAELVDNDVFSYHVNRKVWQILWDFIMSPYGFGWGGADFKNDTFEFRAYRWNDEHNDYHFWHFPSGFKIEWYKYPMRGAYCNMEISDNQFVDILYDCINSIEREKKPSIIHDIDKWWKPEVENE